MFFLLSALSASEVSQLEDRIHAASTALESGEYDKAEKLLDGAQEKAQSLDPNGRLVAEVLDRLGVAMEGQAKFRDAVALLEESVAIRERIFGSDSLEVGKSLSNLAGVYAALGRSHDALKSYEKAMRGLASRKGDSDAEVYNVINRISINMAIGYCDTGSYWKAERLLNFALERTIKSYGAENTQIAEIANALATVFIQEGRFSEALQLANRSCELEEKFYGSKRPEIILHLTTVALIYRRLGRPQDAEPILVRARVLADKLLVNKHPTTGSILVGQAGIYLDEKRYSEAEPLLHDALAIFENALGKSHRSVGKVCSRMGDLYRLQGKHADAIPWYQRATAILEKTVADDSPDLEEATLNFSASLHSLGQDQEATRLELSAQQIRERRQQAQVAPSDPSEDPLNP